MGAWWCWQNYVDSASTEIEASSEAEEMPASNVAVRQTTDVWQPNTTSESLTITFGSVRTLQTFALRFPRDNASIEEDAVSYVEPTDQVRYRLYDASNVVLLDTTNMNIGAHPQYGVHCYLHSTAIPLVKKVVIDLNIASRVTEGYFQLSRVFLGPARFEPKVGIGEGSDFDHPDESTTVRAAKALAYYTDQDEIGRAWRLTFGGIKESERYTVEDFMRVIGTRRQFLSGRRSTGDLSREVIFCHLTSTGGLSVRQGPIYTKPLLLIEE